MRGGSADFFSYVDQKRSGLPRPIDPIDYIRNLEITTFFRYIQKHPDMDHMSGLYRLYSQENIKIINFWDTNNNKIQDFNGYGKRKFDIKDWQEYKRLRDSTSEPNSHYYYRDSVESYFKEDGITILSPTKELVEKANRIKDYNKLSYVLLIQFAGHKVVLGGDADPEVWEDIINNTNLKEMLRNVSILKASHHGRDSCFHEESVKIMAPQYTISSVGKKPDNDAHNKYKKYTEKKVLSTRFRGTITLTVQDNGEASINWTHN